MNKIFLFLFSLTFCFIFYLMVAGTSYAAFSGPTSPYSLQAMTGTKAGTVDISWMDDGTANQYDLTYGSDSNANMWGVQNIKENVGMLTKFTVGELTPGTTYYFMLISEVSGTFVAKSGPVSAMAKSGMVQATPTMQPSTQSVNEGPTSRYNFQVMTGQNSGTVDLKWKDDESANQYDLVYGLEPGKYLWGVQDIKENMNMTNTFTVKSLQPETKYYFSLVAQNNDSFFLQAGPLSTFSK